MKSKCPLPSSGLKLGLVSAVMLLVISSPVVILVNPSLIAYQQQQQEERQQEPSPSSAAATVADNRVLGPSTLAQDGDFTAQAPLQIPRTLQSNDLVNSLAFYEVTFITSTTGAIDKIRMDFPAGTGVGAAGIIERVGIGGGTLLKSGSSITYDVTAPVSVPAGTFIRLEMFGIKNPITPSTSFTADITTRDSGGGLIDGPSPTNVYTIKKIVSSDIADGAITFTKPAESFMKGYRLLDDAVGNAKGWNPDGVTTSFTILEPLTCDFVNVCAFISSLVVSSLSGNHFCDVSMVDLLSQDRFIVSCSSPPASGDVLFYVVEHLPPHFS